MKRLVLVSARKAILSLVCVCLLPSVVFAESKEDKLSLGKFYTTLPAIKSSDKLGQLVKAEQIDTDSEGVKAWRIAYISSDVNGHKTMVTGTVAYPKTMAQKSGRPIVAWSHGTTGTAQNCGPSQVVNPVQPLSLYFMPNNANAQWGDIGMPALNQFMKAGYVVVATDYQGLGGGGKHQYTVAATHAHDVINSVRAVKQLKDAKAGNDAIVYGWSQGGGSTLAVAGQADYIDAKGSAADNVKFIGFVAIAPPYLSAIIPDRDLSESEAIEVNTALESSFSAHYFNFTHYMQNLWGTSNAFPELKLTDILTESGAIAINEIITHKCIHSAADEINYLYGDNYKELLRPDMQNAKAWLKAYKKGDVEFRKPVAPVIIYYGNKDIEVAPAMGGVYRKQMCALGGNVSRVELPGMDHFTSPIAAEPLYVSWVADRFAGKDIKNGCTTN